MNGPRAGIVKYQLSCWLKNQVASLPERGIDNVQAVVTYEEDSNYTARIKVVRSGGETKYFEFRLKEITGEKTT